MSPGDTNLPAVLGQTSTLLRELIPFHDIALRVSIEVGRLKLSVRDFMTMSAGSVLGLKKPAGEPFEIAVNGKAVARGEVIMVEQSSGVRVVEIFRASGTAA